MRKFKFVDDQSYKFWNIELSGSSYTVAWGRIGTKGQSKTKDFATKDAAQKAYDKIIAEKLADGYIEITPAAAPAVTTDNVLEKAIAHDFDDLGAHAAYADTLTQQGDPRGEFIQVQLALEDLATTSAQRKELQKREKELLEAHGKTWLGALGEDLLAPLPEWRRQSSSAERFHFSRGWLEMIRIDGLSVRMARTFAKAPECRFLQRLYIEGTAYEEPGEFEPGDDIPAETQYPAMYAILRSPYLGNLRVFYLGEPEEEANCHISGETAVDLVSRMPHLEELYLLAHRVDMKTLFAMKTLTKLRILQLYHNYHYPLEILAENAALSNVTHLLFYPHGLEPDDEEAYISLAGVRAIVNSPHLKKLTHLRVRLSDMGDDGIEEIVKSGVLKHLKMLDVMHGRVSDEGAKMLAACKDVRNLELLEISNNYLTKEGVNALKKAGIGKVESTAQYDPSAGHDELEYLWMGDPE
jgi:uncharacterized protein (TIGR02996 family)